MAIRIDDVKLTTNYGWKDIKNLSNWNAVKNNHQSWQQLYTQTTIVGNPVKIEVSISEDNWLNLKEAFNTWADIKNKFPSWLDVKNY